MVCPPNFSRFVSSGLKKLNFRCKKPQESPWLTSRAKNLGTMNFSTFFIFKDPLFLEL